MTKKRVFKSTHKNTKGKVTYTRSQVRANARQMISFKKKNNLFRQEFLDLSKRLDNTLLVFVLRFFVCLLVLSQGIRIGVNFSTQVET